MGDRANDDRAAGSSSSVSSCTQLPAGQEGSGMGAASWSSEQRHPLFAYWVAHSQGYRVEQGRKRIGFVEETLIDERNAGMVLTVRGGVLGRRIGLVHSDEVVEVSPRDRRILLRGASNCDLSS